MVTALDATNQASQILLDTRIDFALARTFTAQDYDALRSVFALN